MSAALPCVDSQRADKWLFYARFCKSRGLAAHLCEAGRLRVNRVRIRKSHHGLKAGDVLTFPQGKRIRVVRIKALPLRRVPARDAAALYEDLEA